MHSFRSALVFTLPILLGACAHGLAPRSPAGSDLSCIVTPDSGVPVRPVVNIGVREPFSLDSAPRPRNFEERLVMRQMYGTLITTDCGGRIGPGLAQRWSRDDTGTVWTFWITPGLRSSHGNILDAATIRTSWDRRRNGGLWPASDILEVEVAGPLELRVHLTTAHREVPLLFADPALGVTGAVLPGRVPEETGAFRYFVQVDPPAGPLRRVWQLAPYDSGMQSPILRVEVGLSRVDQRDMLDFPATGTLRPADLLATRDPVVLAYAGGRGDLRVVPLPWDQSYVLITPDSSALSRSGDGLVRFQRSLGDVVRADVQPALSPAWWQSDRRCVAPAVTAQPVTNQVIYPAGDSTARELAERIVALGNSSSESQPNPIADRGTIGGALRIVPLPWAQLTAAVARGNAAGVVLPLPRLAPADCRDIPMWPAESVLLPLVNSRAHLVVRRDVPPFRIDADGAIRFLPAGP